jgi:hypothetical protein
MRRTVSRLPLLFTSKVYHGIREKSIGNIAQKIEPKNVQIVHFLEIPLARVAGERAKNIGK